MRRPSNPSSDAPFFGASLWLPLLTICALVIVAWMSKRFASHALDDPGALNPAPNHTLFDPSVEGRLVSVSWVAGGLEPVTPEALGFECFPGGRVNMRIMVSNRSVYALGLPSDTSLALGLRIGERDAGRIPLVGPLAPPLLPERMQKAMPWPSQRSQNIDLLCPTEVGTSAFAVEFVRDGVGWQHDAKMEKPTWIRGTLTVRPIDDPDLRLKHPLMHQVTPRWSKVRGDEEKVTQMQRAYLVAFRLLLTNIGAIEDESFRYQTISPLLETVGNRISYTRAEFEILRSGARWFGAKATLFSADVAKLIVVPTEEERQQEATRQKRSQSGESKSGSGAKPRVPPPSLGKLFSTIQAINLATDTNGPVKVTKDLILKCAEYGDLLRRYLDDREELP